VVSWSSRDYFGRWKALHFAAREAFQPLLLSPFLRGDTLEVWGVSDRLERVAGTLSLELLDFRGTSLWQAPMEILLPADTSRLLWSKSAEELLSGADPGTVVFSATLLPSTGSTPGGANVPYALFYFQPPKALELEAPAIQVQWDGDGEQILLTLQTDVLAKNVYLRVDPGSAGGPDASSSREEGGTQEGEHPSGDADPNLPVTFSDNFFDLLPGRPRTISLDTALPFAEVQRGLRIRTLAEVPREGFPSEIDPVPEPRPDTARVGIGGTGHR
jgi:beta-mannosidase